MTRLALHWQILITMVSGAVIGIIVNAFYGAKRLPEAIVHPAEAIDVLGMDAPQPVPPGRIWSSDSPDRTLIQIDRLIESAAGDDRFLTRRIVVGELQLIERQRRAGAEAWPDIPPQGEQEPPEAMDEDGEQVPRMVVPTFAQLSKSDPAAFALFQHYGRSPSRRLGDLSKMLGDLFLRMLKMVSVPLIITSLLSGVTGLGQADRLGRMFGRTIVYYLATSMLAVAVGLVMVNVLRPGESNEVEQAHAAEMGNHEAKSLPNVLFEQLENMIPVNPFGAVASGEFLSIIAFTIAFGVCTILVGGTAAERISELVEATFHVMMKLTMFIIHLAPFGVFFLMLSVTASQGVEIFATLGWYMLTVACGLAVHAIVILPILLHFVAQRNPWQYAKAMSPALLTAFSSASSNGTLPLTLTCVEQRAGVSNRVSSFVLPLGATVNMDGSALYEVVAVLFIAQFSGHDLTIAQQVVVALTALLASIGAAGIPHAGLVMMAIILQAVGLPTESQGLIIAVDRVLDMCRTSVNVWSDSCGCAVVARFEHQTVDQSAGGEDD